MYVYIPHLYGSLAGNQQIYDHVMYGAFTRFWPSLRISPSQAHKPHTPNHMFIHSRGRCLPSVFSYTPSVLIHTLCAHTHPLCSYTPSVLIHTLCAHTHQTYPLCSYTPSVLIRTKHTPSAPNPKPKCKKEKTTQAVKPQAQKRQLRKQRNPLPTFIRKKKPLWDRIP